ncbi:unnamed protein product [Echinostoma caproni]|uniref:MFS domain-containing protein n=1 Tax=Echinostoma caproni TaxID=27848 RepID=A0A183AT50_9TREM|nr:unnamed protein product [Echinostoma caproni]
MEFMVPMTHQYSIGVFAIYGFRLAYFMGAIFGGLLWKGLFQRKKYYVFGVQLGCLLLFVGYMCMWASSGSREMSWFNLFLFIFGRFLVGFASSFFYCVAAVHLFENAPDAWRGTVGCFPWLAVTLGITTVQSTILHSLFEYAPQRWPVGYAIAVGLPQLVGGSVACLLSNRVPSANLLQISSAVMAGAQFVLSCLFTFRKFYELTHLSPRSNPIRPYCLILCPALEQQPQLKPVSPYLIFFIALGLFAHGLGWGPIPLLLVNQMYPTDKRCWAVGIAISVTSLAQSFVFALFDVVITVMGISVYFYVASAVCLFATFQVQAKYSTDMAYSFKDSLPRPSLKLKLHQIGHPFQVDSESGARLFGGGRLLLGPRLKTV